MKSTRAEIPNGILFVFDPCNKDVTVPSYVDRSLVSANEACISVGTQAPVDGEVVIVLSQDEIDRTGLDEVFSGKIKPPGLRVAIFTAVRELLLEAPVSGAETDIKVWVDDSREPGRVVVMIIRSMLLFVATITTLCTPIDAAASFQFVGVQFRAGHPAPGESLESALNSSEFDQTLYLIDDIVVLKRAPGFRVEITGFADSLECAGQECRDLSLRRARLVYDWLVDHGAPKECLVGPTGRGSEELLYPTGEEKQRQRNRRVEVNYLRYETTSSPVGK